MVTQLRVNPAAALVLATLTATAAFICALLPAAEPEIVTSEGVTRTRLLPPGENNPRNSEGDFIRLRDGRILLVYTHFTGGGSDHSSAYLAGRYSSDGGRTWSKRDTAILPNEGRMNVMSVSLLRLASGEIALFYLRKNSLDDCRPYMRTSSDETKTWSAPVLCIAPVGYYVVNNDRTVQLSSGRLVVPTARHNIAGGKWTSRGVAMCFLSEDQGRTWRKSTDELEAPVDSRSGLQEPGVVELKDRRLLMLCRTDQGCQYRSYSDDGGETWSAAQRTDILSPVSPASIERIPTTGDLVLVWNNHRDVDAAHRAKRTPLHIAISRDEGCTWATAKTLEDDPDGWYCYTAIHFQDNRILLGHCAGNSKLGRLNQTQITLVDLDWLYR